jgi:hypothetical protein
MLPSIGVGVSSEVYLRGADGPDSGVRRSTLYSDSLAVGAGRSVVSTKSCMVVKASWRGMDNLVSVVRRSAIPTENCVAVVLSSVFVVA